MKSPSIRQTLLLRCVLAVAVLLSLISVGIYYIVKSSLYREIDGSISQTAAVLANQVEFENDEIIYEWREGLGTNIALIEDGFFQFWDETTGTTSRSQGLGSLNLKRFCGKNGKPLLRSITLPNKHRARAIGLRIYPFVLPEEREKMRLRGSTADPNLRPQILVVARDSEPVHRTLAKVRWILLGGGLLTACLGVVLLDRAIRVSLQPINDLDKQMKERAEHQLDSALDVPGRLPSELVSLTTSFDSLLARVAAIRQREKDFIRHAAHELRTPIAGLRATTDLALSQKNRSATAYAESLDVCQKSAIELGNLVARLSALSRIGQTSVAISTTPLDLENILNRCLAEFRPRIQEAGLILNYQPSAVPLPTLTDPTLLGIILKNLIDNAISYSIRPGEIRLKTSSATGRTVVKISNPAENLPENLDRLFEPLFRKENSRTDAGSHLGIGLTLSLEAATAIGAGLKAHRPDPGWIEFVLELPT